MSYYQIKISLLRLLVYILWYSAFLYDKITFFRYFNFIARRWFKINLTAGALLRNKYSFYLQLESCQSDYLLKFKYLSSIQNSKIHLSRLEHIFVMFPSLVIKYSSLFGLPSKLFNTRVPSSRTLAVKYTCWLIGNAHILFIRNQNFYKYTGTFTLVSSLACYITSSICHTCLNTLLNNYFRYQHIIC